MPCTYTHMEADDYDNGQGGQTMGENSHGYLRQLLLLELSLSLSLSSSSSPPPSRRRRSLASSWGLADHCRWAVCWTSNNSASLSLPLPSLPVWHTTLERLLRAPANTQRAGSGMQ